MSIWTLNQFKKEIAQVRERLGLTPYQFSTVEDMKLSTVLNNGDICITFGDEIVGDSLNKVFKIVSSEDQVPDGITEYITLDSGQVAYLFSFFSKGDEATTIVLSSLIPLNINTALNSETILSYKFSMLSSGSGTVKYYVDSILKATNIISTGEIYFDISPYITTTGNHVVEVVVSNTSRGSASLTYVINVISLSITSIFNDSEFYTGDITFRYTPYGVIEKTIHFKIDGNEISTATVTASRIQQIQLINALSHGAHILEVYATASVGGVIIKSNTLRYMLVTYEEGNNEVIIAADFTLETITEGTVLNIPYRVYDPNLLETPIELYVNDVLRTSLVVDRGLHSWNLLNYPVGEVELSIRAGSMRKDFIVQVEESEIEVEAVTQDLGLYLTSVGRSNYESTGRDVWAYESGQGTLSGFNWLSNGWLPNSEGETVLRVSGDARVNIPYKLFQDDARNFGMTLEVEFKSFNVSDLDTTLISCVQNNIGLKITPQKVIFSSELMNEALGSAIENEYKDNEKIRISFVVEPRSVNKLIYVYINGVCSGITQYDNVDNFTQSSPVGITIGSSDSWIDIYTIRKYNTALTSEQILNNYIADTNLMSKKIALYNKNSIFDSYSNVNYSEIINRIPCLTIIGDLPLVKGDKKKVSIIYENRQDPERDIPLTSDVGIDVQGTSSQYYPRKNYKLKFPMPYLLRGELESKPEKVFTFKADYMESSHSHNTGNARIINDMMKATAPIPPQETDPLIRTTIDGFPCVIFHRTDVDSPLDCMGAFNFNYDKDCPDTFGQKDGVECWEFCDNSAPRCNFLMWDHERLVSSDFEARYPDLDADDPEATVNLQRVIEWTASCNGDVQKFKNEVADYWILPGLLAYYCIAITLGMTDSMAKNLFIESFDGNHWYPIFYDMDTCYGLNNEGVVAFDYGIEFKDAYGESGHVFNGHQSVLWSMLELAFHDEIKQMYKDLRSNGLDYNSIVDIFINKQIDPIPEALYNYDANFKYLQPLYNEGIGTYLYMAQGTREHHFKWWLDNRFRYLDSKYMGSEYMDDYATMRLYTPSGSLEVPASGAFTLTSAIDQYLTVKFGAEIVTVKAEKGVPTLISPISSGFNDTETIIYGASNITDIGAVANKYAGTVDMSKAVRLTKLIIGSDIVGYQNTNLHGLYLGNNTLLRELNVVNCINLGGSIDLSGCLGLEEVYATNTAITSVLLPVGGNLKILQLPVTIVNLSILNHEAITDLTLQGYTNLTALRIENCPTVDILDIMTKATNLQRVRLIGVDLIVDDGTFLENLKAYKGIDENGNFTDSAVITGHIHINAAGENAVNALRLYYPDLEITCTTYLKECTVTFVNYDGTVLEVQYVIEGGSCSNPVTRLDDPIDTPLKPSDPQYSYTFSSWLGTFTNVYTDRTITAQYTSTVRTYTVRFYDGETLLQTVNNVSYGSNATFTEDYPTKSGYLFNGWIPSNINIQGETDCIAQFAPLIVPSSPKSFEDYTWAELKALKDAEIGTVDYMVDSGVKVLCEYDPFKTDVRYPNPPTSAPGNWQSWQRWPSELQASPDGLAVWHRYSTNEFYVLDVAADKTASNKRNYSSLSLAPGAWKPLDATHVLLVDPTTNELKVLEISGASYSFIQTVGSVPSGATNLVISKNRDYALVVGGSGTTGWAKLYSLTGVVATFLVDLYADNQLTALEFCQVARFTADDRIVIAGKTAINTGFIKLYSLTEGVVTYIGDAPSGTGDTLNTIVMYMDVTPDGTKLVAGGNVANTALSMWSITETGLTFISTTPVISASHGINNLIMSTIGDAFAVSGGWNGIFIYYIVGTSFVKISPTPLENALARALMVFPDGTFMHASGTAACVHQINSPVITPVKIPWLAVGDTKTIVLDTNETVVLQIYDIKQDNYTSGGKAFLTIGTKDLLNDTRVMNASASNIGGWHASAMRTWLNSTLLASLPAEVKLIIQFVNKITNEGNNSSVLITDSDKIFIPAMKELGITYASVPTIENDALTAYAIFTTNASRIKNISGVATSYYTRSAISDEFKFSQINTIGTPQASMANEAAGVCFAFCI